MRVVAVVSRQVKIPLKVRVRGCEKLRRRCEQVRLRWSVRMAWRRDLHLRAALDSGGAPLTREA